MQKVKGVKVTRKVKTVKRKFCIVVVVVGESLGSEPSVVEPFSFRFARVFSLDCRFHSCIEVSRCSCRVRCSFCRNSFGTSLSEVSSSLASPLFYWWCWIALRLWRRSFRLIYVVGVWGVQIPAFVLFRFLFALAVCLRGHSIHVKKKHTFTIIAMNYVQEQLNRKSSEMVS